MVRAHRRRSSPRRSRSSANPSSTAWRSRCSTRTAGSPAAATRGDGVTGEDVTANVATIASHPRPPRRVPRCRRGSRCGARCSCRSRRSRSSTGARARRASDCSRTRATPRPGACARRTRASRRHATSTSSPTSSACKTVVRGCDRTTRRSRGSRDLGLPVNPHIEQLAAIDAVADVLRAHARSSATRSATRSTAPS